MHMRNPGTVDIHSFHQQDAYCSQTPFCMYMYPVHDNEILEQSGDLYGGPKGRAMR